MVRVDGGFYPAFALIHLLQAAVLGSYVPALATSLVVLPYCVYALRIVARQEMFTGAQTVLWSVEGIILAGGNLFLAHRLAAAFDRWEQRT